MSKYITKPVIIEAEQFIPSKLGHGKLNDDGDIPACPKGMHLWPDENDNQPKDMSWGYCDTRQGRVHVHANDWIITLDDGESYPCKPDVFERKYKLLEEEA